MKNSTQKQRVIDKLNTDGVVDNFWAINNYILRLGAIILELKKDGWKIKGKFGIGKNRKNFHYYKENSISSNAIPETPSSVGNISFTDLGNGKFEVTGAHNKKYIAEHLGGFWSCTCDAYRFSSKKLCKHISTIVKHIDDLANEEAAKHQIAMF